MAGKTTGLIMCASFVLLAGAAGGTVEISSKKLITWHTFDEGKGAWALDSATEGRVSDRSELKGKAKWAKDGVHKGAVYFPGKNGSYLYLSHLSKDIQAIRGEPHRRATFAFWFKCADKDKGKAVQTLFETGGYHNNINVFIYEGVLHVGIIGGYPKAHQPPQWMNTKQNLCKGVGWKMRNGKWHHFALVIEADTKPVPNGYRVYLDGKLTMTGLGVQVDGHGAQSALGAANDEAIYPSARHGWTQIPTNPRAPDADGNRYTEAEARGIHPFAGFMDDFRLYKRVLTAEELKTLYENGTKQ